MLVDDSVDHGKPKSRSLPRFLRREEGLVDMFNYLGGHSMTGIGNGDQNVIAGIGPTVQFAKIMIGLKIFRLDGELASFGHGIPGIHAQVDEHMLHHSRIRQHRIEVFSGIDIEIDIHADNTVEHFHQVGDQFVDVQGTGHDYFLAAEGQQLPGHARRTVRGSHHLFQGGADEAVCWSLGRGQLAVPADDLEHVVDVVGDPPRQLTHGLHLLDLAKLLFQHGPVRNIHQRDLGGHLAFPLDFLGEGIQPDFLSILAHSVESRLVGPGAIHRFRIFLLALKFGKVLGSDQGEQRFQGNDFRGGAVPEKIGKGLVHEHRVELAVDGNALQRVFDQAAETPFIGLEGLNCIFLLFPELNIPETAIQGGCKDIEVERLAEIIVRAALEGFDGGFGIREGGHQDKQHVGILVPHHRDQIGALRVADAQIHKHYLGIELVQGVLHRICIEYLLDLISPRKQEIFQGFGKIPIVVYDQNVFR